MSPITLPLKKSVEATKKLDEAITATEFQYELDSKRTDAMAASRVVVNGPYPVAIADNFKSTTSRPIPIARSIHPTIVPTPSTRMPVSHSKDIFE
jgi:hypothetical protein